MRIKVFAFTLVGLLTATACIPVIADGTPQPSFRIMRYVAGDDVDLPQMALLRMETVQKALDYSDLQKVRQAAIQQKFKDTMSAAAKMGEPDKRRAAVMAARDETEAALLGNLEPAQRERLDQIQLQLQGPAAFTKPDLAQRLELSSDQIATTQRIAQEGHERMAQAARIPLPFKDGDPSLTEEEIRKLVESNEFQLTKQKHWLELFGVRDATLRRIEDALSKGERDAFRIMTGAPLDVESFFLEMAPKGAATNDDIAGVADQLGLLDQRADLNFDVKVAQPAYVSEHPAVLFDEAHHNFHTSGGRYKAFADLVANDGYRLTANQEEFTAPRLASYRILVIANAMGAKEMGDPAAGNSAFTAAECEAVVDWIEAGGSLLLITDHDPFGSAAQQLANRLGVNMSTGVTVDQLNETEDGLLFSRDKHLLGNHPITNGRNESEQVNRVLTFTGQSLSGPTGSVPFLIFSDTALDLAKGKNTSAAGRAQGVAFTRGQGRVVILGEAAELSAQVSGFPPTPMGMNVPGCDNRQMALNIMHWLSGLTR
jgi:DNA-binding TFAR19-related protein (PDSD5 family)